MQARRFKSGGAVILIAAGAALAGCGDDSDREPERPAQIPAGVAEQLASLSDEVAAALEGGDPCGAELAADELARTAEEVEQRIPVQLRTEVRAGVEQLKSRIECVPPPPVESEQPQQAGEGTGDGCPPGLVKKEDDEGGKGKGEGKGKGNDDKDAQKRLKEECEEVEED